MLKLSDIAFALQVPLPPAAASIPITGVATLNEAGATDLSFLNADAYLKEFDKTQAAAVLVHKRVKLPKTDKIVLVVEDADLAMSEVLQLFAPPIPRPPVGVDQLARVSSTAKLGENVAIGPFVTIGDRARIGLNSVIHPNVSIGADVVIGDNCEIFPNVTVRERCNIGHRVIINAGSVIGTDGFGYRWDGKQHAKVPQIGTVIIEDDVEIGSCVCVDRAKFSVTRIGRGTKIDNLVQVAHNVTIGPHCIIVGQAGMAGSVTLGAGAVLGGQCAIRDHIKIGDQAMVAATAGVLEDVPPKTIVSGTPALPHRQSLREQAALRHLPDLRVQLRKLQEEVDELKKK
jgi:UDP-3-O-[3-hydroxymyristoyl] glucosamine N-acyltransferase